MRVPNPLGSFPLESSSPMLRCIPMGSIEPVYLRTAVLATLAVVVSYSLGNASIFIAADIAAIWALVTVRATFHAAAKESAVQILGSIIGGLIGFLAVQSYGFSLGLLAILVLFSFAAGMLLRLGLEGSVIMGFTIIAIMSNSFSLESTEARVAGVITGTIVAMVFSLFITGGTPQKRVRKELEVLQQRKQEALSKVSAAIADGPMPAELMFDIKISSKALLNEAESLEDTARELTSAAKWSPLTPESEAAAILDDALRLKDDANTLVDMIGSLETLGAALPATVADYAKWSIARAASNIEEETENSSYTEMPNYTITDLTPTQVIYTSDLIAGAEKIRRRRKVIVNQPTGARNKGLKSVAKRIKPSKKK